MSTTTRNISLGNRVRSICGIRLGILEQGSTRYLLQQVLNNDGSHGDVGILPRISIVTPSYNQGRFIGRTIESVLSQEYSNLEYIVQDNQSDDCTLEILKSVNSPDFSFRVERDSGQADAINKGFSRCTGEIMGYLNSDDVLLPGALSQVARIFRQNPRVDVVYGNRVIIDIEDNIVGRWVVPRHDGVLLRHVDYVPQETLFWRRSLWDRSGGHLDDKLRFALDWDLLLRFLDCGARFTSVPCFLGGFRVYGEQKTNSLYGSNGVIEMRLLRRKHAPGIVSKAWMPIRHLLFLFEHIWADRKHSALLEPTRK